MGVKIVPAFRNRLSGQNRYSELLSKVDPALQVVGPPPKPQADVLIGVFFLVLLIQSRCQTNPVSF